MMFSHFFMGIQQDIKLAILAPIMCAIFIDRRSLFPMIANVYGNFTDTDFGGAWILMRMCF